MQSGKQMHDSPERDAPIFCCCHEAGHRPISSVTMVGYKKTSIKRTKRPPRDTAGRFISTEILVAKGPQEFSERTQESRRMWNFRVET